MGQPMGCCFVVGPGDEVLHPIPSVWTVREPVPARVAAQVVGVVVEQQLAVGNHAFQDTDGVHDRCDGRPGNIADFALGAVVVIDASRHAVPRAGR